MTLLGNFVRTSGQRRYDKGREGCCPKKETGHFPEPHAKARWPMSMKPSGLEPIPEETRALMQRLSPQGTMVSQLRDALGPIYSDESFVHLFPTRGRAAEAPWRLALVTVLQAIEVLTDRQAAEHLPTRIDWSYALALPLSDPRFDYSILTDL